MHRVSPYRLGVRFRLSFAALVVMSMPLTACTGTVTEDTDTADKPSLTLGARLSARCGDVEVPRLGSGTLCVDTRFTPKEDGFSFANFGRSTRADENVTAQTLIDLFGHDTVCLPGAPTECIMRPPAVQLLERWNTALAGGRCEGLATLSARFFLNQEHPQRYVTSAVNTTDLGPINRSLAESVVYWWATQFAEEVARSAENSRRKSPLVLVDELITDLGDDETGVTLAMYFGNRGHAVTPFAVTKRDDNFVIHVYDNNFPGRRREILVNMTTNSWLYLGASESIDGTPVDWAGSTGTLELTKMSQREGPFTCPFCTVMTDDSPTIVTLASRDAQKPGFLHISSSSGTFEATPDGVESTIKGLTWSIGKGNRGLLTVQIPPKVSTFDVAVDPGPGGTPAGDVVLSIERGGFARLQVAGDLAVTQTGTDPTPVVTSSRSTMKVTAPTQSKIAVSLARRGTLATHSLEPDHELNVSRVDDNTISLQVKGAGGSSGVDLPTVATDTSERVKIVVDSDGMLAVETNRPTAVTSRRQRTVTFTRSPRPKPQTTTTVPSIDVSEPD